MFLHRRWQAAVLAVVAGALSPAVVAAQTEVIGKNDPALDVAAVQAAVAQGGKVLLRGTFDFGDSGRVLLEKDVEISGEVDGAGAPLTIVLGGEWTFFTPLPTAMPPATKGPAVSIHHLWFEGAKGNAIHLAHSGGASIHHNHISGLRARVLNAAQGTLVREGVVIGPEHTRPRTDLSLTPLLVSGRIEVLDNTIDVAGAEPSSKTRATGVFISMYVGADVRVERNDVRNCTRVCINVLDGVADDAGKGSVVVAENAIFADEAQPFIGPGPRAPIGIITGFNNVRDLGTDPDLRTIPVLVADNHIDLSGPVPMGIINIFNDATLKGNVITVRGDATKTLNRLSTSGGILATTSRQLLLHNEIRGDGCNAIRIGGTLDGQERYGNVVIGNDVSEFVAFMGGFAKCADYWLEPASHDNTIVGNGGVVIDDGVDNRTTGVRPEEKGGGGDGVSTAIAPDAAPEDPGFGFAGPGPSLD